MRAVFYLFTFISFYLFLVPCDVYAQEISGIVRSEISGEILEGASIYCLEYQTGSITNERGAYSIKCNSYDTTFTLVVSYVGHEQDTFTIKNCGSTVQDILLRGELSNLSVEVVGKYIDSEKATHNSTNRLTNQEILRIPALFGEADPIRAMQVMPGVQSGIEGQTGLFVRGGGNDQNLVLLDGLPVYKPDHIFGFFSTFDINAVEKVNLIKGGFPARFGGRLSSVVDVEMKTGRVDQSSRGFSLGPLITKAYISGGFGKITYHISGRRTLFDLLIAPFINSSTDNNLAFYFGDANIKLEYNISKNDRLVFSGYYGKDRYDQTRIQPQNTSSTVRTSQELLSWYNLLGNLRYDKVWSDRLTQNTYIGNTIYSYENGSAFSEENLLRRESSSLLYSADVAETMFRTSLTFKGKKNNILKVGVNSSYRRFIPGRFTIANSTTISGIEASQDTMFSRIASSNFDHNFYAEKILDIGEKISLNAGVRFGWLNGEHFKIQPRLSVETKINSKDELNISFASMRQNTHLLISGTLGLPRDIWIPANNDLPPQDSWQVALGVKRQLKPGLRVAIEAYYKSMNNVVNYRPGAGVTSSEDFSELVVKGKGEAYGLECFVEKSVGRFRGRLSNTLSWSWRTFSEINQGNPFPYRYDRRNNLYITGDYSVSPNKILLSAGFTYQTGNPITLLNDRVLPLNRELSIGSFLTFADVNGYRIPPTHRLDLGVSFQKIKNNYERVIAIGAYNVYARRNPYYVNVENERTLDGLRGQLVKVSLFRLVPSLSYTIKWH
ncbi:TonB-dependent receptor [Neolewinella aurantiaca]|uniref:TonB-dependent receptor n=1 Tax=Neolewinella aurantiaca TaxID=2602767 RepID=A0A5C7EZW6_9BACT|nr:carboxypeptidase-like regulatory domain-containing protein [Neolewinella aurantiaca]TXF82107.1 TonB-dependent receptor [Neolewinella aurantiaca]